MTRSRKPLPASVGSTVYRVLWYSGQPCLAQATYLGRNESWHTFQDNQGKWRENGFHWFTSPRSAWLSSLKTSAFFLTICRPNQEADSLQRLFALALAAGKYFCEHPEQAQQGT
jgi:hypothetical protein